LYLLLVHPEIALRDCEDCRIHVYNKLGNRASRKSTPDVPIPRPPGTFPKCHKNPKGCPKGHYDSKKELSTKNYMAYVHYLECKGSMHFPYDPIVRRNGGVILETEQIADYVKQLKTKLTF